MAEPSKVIHVRNVGHEISENDLLQLFQPFGVITKLVMLRAKNQALLQMQDVASAVSALQFYANVQPSIRGRNVYVQFSSHQELTTMDQSQGREDEPNRILLVTVHQMLYPITVDVLHQVFSPHGYVEKIVTFQKSAGFQALIQYQSRQSAVTARTTLQGRNIYDGCCQLDIQFSNLDELQVNYNNDRSRDYTNPNLPTEQKGRSSQSGYGDAGMYSGVQGSGPRAVGFSQMANAAAIAAAFGGGLPPGITGTNERCTVLVANLNKTKHYTKLQKMGTRRARCTQCGRPMLVSLESSYGTSMMCSGCQGSSQLRPYYPSVNNHTNTSPFTNNYPGPAYGSHGQFSYHQPRPLRAPPLSMTPPSPYGNKRAVLLGISYGDRVNRLKGSVNDVQCMKYFLTHKLGFPNDSIRMLTDDPEERNPLRIPTKYNIRMAMRWLVEGCQPGDSLVFHYSGHGSRVIDHGMDEVDGYDEAICPVDYEDQGKILDDEINATIVRPLPHGVKLHAIIDTCFSGTVLDLPFMCRMNRKGYYGWEDHRNPRAGYKGTRGGLAICISACDDDGSAADTSAFSGMESAGALTYSFIQAMQEEPKLTYGRLLNAMRSMIRGAKEGTFGLNHQQPGMDNRQQYAHEPQLSCTEKFDIYSKSIAM